MPAMDLVIPQIHPALLLLPQSVVVLDPCRPSRRYSRQRGSPLCRRRQRGHLRAFRLHRPGAHVQQCLAGRPLLPSSDRCADHPCRTCQSRYLATEGSMRRAASAAATYHSAGSPADANHHSRRSEDVVAFRVLVARPSRPETGLATNPYQGPSSPLLLPVLILIRNVRSVGTERNRSPIPHHLQCPALSESRPAE